MKNILTMAATGLVIFASLGWYLDWYRVSRTTTPDGKQHIGIDLNTQRIKSDIQNGENKLTSYIRSNTGGFPAVTPPLQAPAQPNQSFFPPTTPPNAYPPGYQQPVFPPGNQPFYPPPNQPAAPQGWLPTNPASRPNTGGPFQPIPGRTF